MTAHPCPRVGRSVTDAELTTLGPEGPAILQGDAVHIEAADYAFGVPGEAGAADMGVGVRGPGVGIAAGPPNASKGRVQGAARAKRSLCFTVATHPLWVPRRKVVAYLSSISIARFGVRRQPVCLITSQNWGRDCHCHYRAWVEER